MLRKAVVAGQFYASKFGDLDKQIRDGFLSKLGPGEMPIKKRGREIYGAIVPHAGYQFSGACAAWAYKELAEAKMPDVYIIIGTNHTGIGANISTYLFGDWETPFGIVKIDKNFGKQLIKKCPELINEAEAHMHEHSVEVQLPFLQFINREYLSGLKFVPIVLKDIDYAKVCKLADAITDTEENICVIGSSDLTHYGPAYNYVPFLHAKKDNLTKLDKRILNLVVNMDGRELLKNKEKSTVCGMNAMAVVIECCRAFGIKRGNFLRYYSSGDVTGDYDNSVGYGSVVFEKK